MAVKGKGKQVAESPPPPASTLSKRRKVSCASGDVGTSSRRGGDGGSKRRRDGVLRFFDDAAYVADDEDLESDGDEAEDDFVDEGKNDDVSLRVHGKSHPLPFLVKEEELSGDELEEMIKNRYGCGVKYVEDDDVKESNDTVTVADMLSDPAIWRLKCMVGRERQMAFCFMQKFVDLHNFGTKLPIISAFALDHVRGFVFVEAAKACDVAEACKGFCSVYPSTISTVPANEVPNLLSSRNKPFALSAGAWVRMKSGNYKGDLAQVVSLDDDRKKVMVKLIPRVDFLAISKKLGGAVSLRQAAVPAPRLISSHELDLFRPHIETRRDRQTGDVFEVLDGMMFKDGFLYKRVAISSLICWGIQPTETELLKFSTPRKDDVEGVDWISSIYGPNKRNLTKGSNLKASTSKEDTSKGSNLKASTSKEDYEDDFSVHDLVLFGRKDFGVIIAVEKDGYRILKGGPEGFSVVVKKQDINKVLVDKMFTALDQNKKIIRINDPVKVLDGPFQGKQGSVKHMFKGFLFIYDESVDENNGFLCAKSEFSENVKKPKEPLGSAAETFGDNSGSMFSEPPQFEQHEPGERRRRYDKEQLFSIGQTLRIRKGPLKGYLCRVVRIFRNDVTVKLDSLVKIITVEAQFLSVPARKGDDSTGAANDLSGSQDLPLSGTQAGENSWEKELSAFGSDSWQPFASSIPSVAGTSDQNADESEADPWGKKVQSSAGDDAWGKLASSTGGQDSAWNKTASHERASQNASGQTENCQKIEVWSTNTSQQPGSNDSVWARAVEKHGSSGASCWDRAAISKDNGKSIDWGQLSSLPSTEAVINDKTDPWGSKGKERATEETDNWGAASMKQDKNDSGSPGWGQPSGSLRRQEKNKVFEDGNHSGGSNTASGCWTQSVATEGAEQGNADPWTKLQDLSTAQDDFWGKSTERNDTGKGAWEKPETSQQPNQSGGWDNAASRLNQLSVTEEDAWGKAKDSSAAEDDAWGKSTEKVEAEIGAWSRAGASNQASTNSMDKPKKFGGDGMSSWSKGEETDRDNQRDSWNKPKSFEGGRGLGQGRGRGRGAGDWGNRDDQDSWKRPAGHDGFEKFGWGAGNYGDSEAGRDGDFSGSNRGRGRYQYGGRGRGRGRDNNWRNSEDQGSRQFEGVGDKSGSANSQQNFGGNWSASMPFSDNRVSLSGWNASGDKQSGGGQEQQIDPWASKVSSAGPEHKNDAWEAKAKDANFDIGGNKQDKAASNWSQKSVQSGPQGGNQNSWEKDSCKETGGWNSAELGGWNSAKSSSQSQTDGWSKPVSSGADQEPSWSKPRYNNGFGRGILGKGRGGNFGDCEGGSGSSWVGGRDGNDDGNGDRPKEGNWNRQRDFDGSRGNNWGRGRGRGWFGGRGSRNQDNNCNESGDQGGGWRSGGGERDRDGGGNDWNGSGERRNFGGGRGGSWSQSADWNNGRASTGYQGSSNSKSNWDQGKSADWGTSKPCSNNDQAGKEDQQNAWNRGSSSGGDGSSAWGKQSANENASTWGTIKGDEDSSWNSARGSGGSSTTWEKPSFGDAEAGKNAGSWERAKEGGSSGADGGAWAKASAGWNESKGGNGGDNGW